MKILAIDFGTKYLGLALADLRINIAFPYQTLKNKNSFLSELKEIIKKEKIEKIIVGRPISMEGRITKQTEITDEFIDFLKKNLSVPVEIFDERLSSKILTTNYQLKVNQFRTNKLFTKKLEGHAAAATVILQNYLDQKARLNSKKGQDYKTLW